MQKFYSSKSLILCTEFKIMQIALNFKSLLRVTESPSCQAEGILAVPFNCHTLAAVCLGSGCLAQPQQQPEHTILISFQ
jgi:hypothetical protein